MKQAALILLFFGIFISIFIMYSSHNSDEYIESIRKDSYFGRIDSVFLDPEERMQPRVLLEDGTKHSIQNSIFKHFKKGGTLQKQSGDMRYSYIKNMDTIYFYQQYNQEDIKDASSSAN